MATAAATAVASLHGQLINRRSNSGLDDRIYMQILCETMQKFAGVKLQFEAVFPPGVTYLQPRLVSVIR